MNEDGNLEGRGRNLAANFSAEMVGDGQSRGGMDGEDGWGGQKRTDEAIG